MVDKLTGAQKTLPARLDYLREVDLPARQLKFPAYESPPPAEIEPSEEETLRRRLEEAKQEIASLNTIIQIKTEEVSNRDVHIAQEARRHQDELAHLQDYIEDLKEAYEHLSRQYQGALKIAESASIHLLEGDLAIKTALAQLVTEAPELPELQQPQEITASTVTQPSKPTLKASHTAFIPCKVSGCHLFFLDQAACDEHRREQHPTHKSVKFCMISGCHFTCLDVRELRSHGDKVHPPASHTAGPPQTGTGGSTLVPPATGGDGAAKKTTARKSSATRPVRTTKTPEESQPTPQETPTVPASQGDPAQSQGDSGATGDASQLAQGDPGQGTTSTKKAPTLWDKMLAYKPYKLKAAATDYCKASNIQEVISDDDDYVIDWHPKKHTCQHHKCKTRAPFSNHKNFIDHYGSHTYMYLCPWCKSGDRIIHRRNLIRHVESCHHAQPFLSQYSSTEEAIADARQQWEPTIMQDLIAAKVQSAADRRAAKKIATKLTITSKKRKAQPKKSKQVKRRRRAVIKDDTASEADSPPRPDPTADPAKDETSGQQVEEEVQDDAEEQRSPRLGQHNPDDDDEEYAADTDVDEEIEVEDRPRGPVIHFKTDDLLLPGFLETDDIIPPAKASASEVGTEQATGDTTETHSASGVPAAGPAKTEPTETVLIPEETPAQQAPTQPQTTDPTEQQQITDPTEQQQSTDPTEQQTTEQGSTTAPIAEETSQEQPSAQ